MSMNQRNRLVAVVCLVVIAGACGPTDNFSESTPAGDDAPGLDAIGTPVDGHSSRDSLDWSGPYSGVTPCADCPGIRTTVTLHGDGSFERTRFYLERSVAPQRQAGQFRWNGSGSAITLQVPDGHGQQYKVAENALIHLDRSGKPIAGELAGRYVLHKHRRDPAIEGRRWALVELRGRPLEAGASGSIPSLALDPEQSIASGSASCNSFSGNYFILSGNRIGFGPDLAVTMMACPDMTTEEDFLDMLRQIDNYAVAGGVLSLSRARTAPLARFAAADD
jgi:heat shock protein HslJ